MTASRVLITVFKRRYSHKEKTYIDTNLLHMEVFALSEYYRHDRTN